MISYVFKYAGKYKKKTFLAMMILTGFRIYWFTS